MSEHFITYEQVEKKIVTKRVRVELAACPFCGGEAEFRTGGNYSSKHGRRMGTGIRCKDCKVVSPTREGPDSQIRAAELWNRREKA